MYLKNNTLCIIISSIVLMFGCSGSKTNQEGMNDFIVNFGHGGGFVGKEERIAIDKKGKISISNGTHTNLSKSEINQILSNIQTLGLKDMNFSEPGNIYEFIEILDSGKVKRFAWDPGSTEVPASLRLLYSNLNYLVKNKSK
ncbi:MAG: hypothetical protein IPN15_17580 [Saprospiraceae bacterium]|nr:hypothetical protein [Candidatus Vicinibacter affinis]